MLQLSQNPPATFSALTRAENLGADEWQLPWQVAYCKPRQEKALAWELHKLGVTYFLPMALKETSSGGRRRKNLYPLFASYIFLAGDESARLTALRTERIVNFITPSDAEQPRLQQELQQLELALRCCGDSLELSPRLVPGARAVVIGGPLKGSEGTVIDADRKHKLLLAITALGAGVTVEIHADLVAPL